MTKNSIKAVLAFKLAILMFCGCGENPPAVREPDASFFSAVLSGNDAAVLVVEIDGKYHDFSDDSAETAFLAKIKRVVMPAKKLSNTSFLPENRLARITVQTGKDPISIDVVSIEDGVVTFFADFVLFHGGPAESFEELKAYFFANRPRNEIKEEGGTDQRWTDQR